MQSGAAPQLPVLVRGQKIQNGPFSVTVTDEMVRDRERQNERLARQWQREQERRRHLTEGLDEYFGEFREQKVRRRFIRRVFSILTLQLVFAASLVAAVLFVPDARLFVLSQPSLLWIAMGLYILTYLAISCSECARQAACGWTFLGLVTLSLAYLAAYSSVFYSDRVVLLAAVSTALVALAISCIATCTSFDLTKYAGSVVIVTMVAAMGLLIILAMASFGYWPLTYAQLAIAMTGTLGLSIYLFFDVQMIMGGRTVAMDPDQVVYATTQLYVDVILLYKFLLMFFNVHQ